MKNCQITKVYYVTCWFDKFFNIILKTINLLCPFQKAFGIEVQARSWASSKFAPTYQSPGHGREPKQEIFLRIQESSQILLDQKPQRQRDIGLVPFDLARHQTHGLYLELVKE